MDAILYFCAIVSIGVGGFLVGRSQRERRDRAQASANLARANARANQRRDARANANRLVIAHPIDDDDSDTSTDGDGDLDGGTRSVYGQGRRRAIHGPDRGYRSYPAVPVGAHRSSDETAIALAVAGYDG